MGHSKMKPWKDRFDSFIEYLYNGCWNWTSAKNNKGYGSFWLNGKAQNAARVSYIRYIGEVQNGMMILHTCDNPSCVNPDHLYTGTNAQNMIDMWSRKRRVGRRPDCHPEKKYVSHGMCRACYKRSRKNTTSCVICQTTLPKYRGKVCSEECGHVRAMELQRQRRRMPKK